MSHWCEIAAAITRETRHPVWGELFRHVIAGELTVADIEAADEIERPCPDWVGAVAGGNPEHLVDVAEIAFEDFIITYIMELEDEEEKKKEKKELEIPIEDLPARVVFNPDVGLTFKGIFLN